MAKSITINLPAKSPLSIRLANHASMKQQLKAKCLPREPRAGEVLLLLKRPQSSPYTFAEYAVGDLLTRHGVKPTNIDPAWLTPDVLALAVRVIEFTDGTAKAALADALEEAGCADASILADLRQEKSEKGTATAIYGSQTRSYVVVAVKPGYTRAGEGWKHWEQLAVARPATEADIAAVAAQRAAQEAETRRVMDRMMQS